MFEASDRYSRIAGGFGARLTGVEDDQWSAPTPCTEWTVRDLVVPVIERQRRVRASLDGSEVEATDREGDIEGQWHTARAAITDALQDAALASTVVGGMFGEQPFDSLVSRLLCADTLVHTWDLARATGQDERLDSSAVSKSMGLLAPIDEKIRRPGGFAGKIAPPADADEQTRFLNFCGRSV